MTAEQLATSDNPADRTIVLRISGNRLVSVLNTLDQLMHETERYRFEGDKVQASSPWYAELREVTEAMRDELSRQRCVKPTIILALDNPPGWQHVDGVFLPPIDWAERN